MSEELQRIFEKAGEVSQQIYEGNKDILAEIPNIDSALGWIKSVMKYLLFGLKNGGEYETKLQKLHEYVSTPKRAEYVISSFRQALLNSSHVVNTIMGLQLSKLSGEQADVTQMDLTIFEALCSFNDFDIKNYKFIYEITRETPFVTDDGDYVNTRLLEQMQNWEDLSMTLVKSERAGLFQYMPTVATQEDLDIGEASDWLEGTGSLESGSFYKPNRASHLFYDMICEAEGLLNL